MCGIVGFTTPGQDPAAAKQIVQGMADLIRHRGPDGEGCYADGTAALGHRRLSVIDLAGGGQPMLNEDGTLVVVFNGEIYNYKTLRARLQQRGHTFATDSDTEVLLHGYEEWGRDLPCRLRGMFAFAVWDRTCGTLFCARDLFGIKPLCYYKKGETLLFASEIKAFLAHPAFEKRLNEARLPDWLSMEYLPDAETLFTGVYELPPAHTLTWQAGRVTLARYAAPRFRAKRGRSLRAWAREIGDAVAESADAHRIADVEVGCFLSGGVDSSLITCEMARRQPAVQCFSVGYAEEAYSELPAARAAAQALGVPESVIALTFVALGTSLPELVTAITSLAKGHGSLSLGNVIGANVFNLVLVSGMSITVSPFSIPQNSTIMGINSSLVMDLPVMFAVMLLLTVPALLKGRLSRWQGVLLLCIYAAFCAVQFAM